MVTPLFPTKGEYVIFPVVELKFTNILRFETGTSCLVRAYRVDDGGLDAEGHQIYLRTLRRERTIFTTRNPTDAQIVTFAREYLIAWALEFGFNLPDDRLICDL